MQNKQTYLACGNFDAVHLGHRKVIDRLANHAKKDQVSSVVILLVNKKLQNKAMVYSYEERRYALKKMGVDNIVYFEYEDFNVSKLVNSVFIDKHHASKYFAGDFATDAIATACTDAGISVERVPLEFNNGLPISADMIAYAIEDSDFRSMNKLMGHNYIVIGEVVHGKGEGHKYGMPTANLSFANTKILPPHGVYATTSVIEGEKFNGYTNIGLRPSADKMTYVSIETLLLDFNRDIYGQQVVLEIVEYIRPVMKFSGGLAEVKKQIEKDIASVRKVFSGSCDSVQ